MKKSIILLSLTLTGCMMLYSCKTQKVSPAPLIACADPQPTYNTDIKPILDSHCAATCHSAKNKAGGINLSAYSTAKAVAVKKKFLGAIRHQAGFLAMPRKAPKLFDADINKIACWVQNGTPE